MQTQRVGLKVALLTPYSGSNLGDGAIQEAVIANLRRRCPSVEIVLFSIDRYRTVRLHAVPCRDLTADSRQPGEIFDAAPSDAGEPGAGGLREKVRKVAWLYGLLRLPFRMVRGLKRLRREVVHTRMIRHVIGGCDLVLVSGGGQIDDYWGGPLAHPYTLYKFATVARALGKPFLVLSSGVCTLDSRLSRFFVDRAMRLATFRTYRDEESKKLIGDLLPAKADRVFPDLAFSLPEERWDRRSSGGSGADRITVGISPIAYLSKFRWPKQEEHVFEGYLGQLTSFTLEMVERGYRVILFSTDGPDFDVIEELVERAGRRLTPEQIESLEVVDVRSVDELFRQYERMDYVVASRLHGIILSHLVPVPVLAISYDRKVDTHMKDLGQSAYCLDLHTVDAGNLVETFDSLVTNREVELEGLSAMTGRKRKQLERLYDEVVGIGRGFDPPREGSVCVGKNVAVDAGSAEPFVSVVTPVYNGEEYLEEAIESVLAQDYRNWEYVIVNNCSTDGSRGIAEEYANRDSRIRVLTYDVLVNAEENHNRCFRAISERSDYCKVVSADDRLRSNCLSTMVGLAKRNPSVGIIGSYQQSGGDILWQGLPRDVEVLSGREACRAGLLEDLTVFGNPTSSLYRSDLLRRDGSFFPHGEPNADSIAYFLHLRDCDYGFCHEVLSEERIHEGQISSGLDQLNWGTMSILETLVDYGALYLTEEELADELEDFRRSHHEVLGGSVWKLRSPGYWRFHHRRAAASGLPINWGRVMAEAVREIYLEARHPGVAVGKMRKALAGQL